MIIYSQHAGVKRQQHESTDEATTSILLVFAPMLSASTLATTSTATVDEPDQWHENKEGDAERKKDGVAHVMGDQLKDKKRGK